MRERGERRVKYNSLEVRMVVNCLILIMEIIR